MTVMTGTLDKMLEGFSKRLYTLEQTVSSPGNYGSSNTFDEVIIDDPEDDEDPIIIVPQAPETPLNVAVVAGSHFDVIYADVEWDPAPTGEVPLIYEIEVAEKIAGVYQIGQIFRTAGTNFRVQPLEPSKTYGVRVTAMSRIGKFSDPTAWVDFNSGTDNTVPAQIIGVIVARGASSAVVKFTPSAELDVAGGKGLYEIQIDTANTFNTANLQRIRTTSWVVAFNGIQTEANYYARVSAIDSSGNQGPWSAVAGPAAIGGVIDSMLVGEFSAAHITFGTMDGDRIAANSASINILETSSLTSADITLAGGSFKAGSPPTTGLLINSQGIRLYQGGVQTITFDASTGAATFKGNITGGTIQIGTRFSVDASGNMTATNVDLSGTINASSGTFSGTITATGTISGGTLVGAWIKASNAGTSSQPAVWISGGTGGSGRDFIYFVVGASTTSAGYIQMYSGSFEIRAPEGGPAIVANSSAIQAVGKQFDSSGYRVNGVQILDSSGGADFINDVQVRATVGGTVKASMSTAGAISGINITTSSFGDFDSLRINGNAWVDSSNQIIRNTTVSGVNLTIASGSNLVLNPSGGATSSVNYSGLNTIFRVTSSGRYKKNIQLAKEDRETVHQTAVIHKLPVRTWNSRLHMDDLGGHDDPNERQIGLVAEEVYEIAPQLVLLNEKGKPESIKDTLLVFYLLAEIQALREEVDALKSAA